MTQLLIRGTSSKPWMGFSGLDTHVVIYRIGNRIHSHNKHLSLVTANQRYSHLWAQMRKEMEKSLYAMRERSMEYAELQSTSKCKGMTGERSPPAGRRGVMQSSAESLFDSSTIEERRCGTFHVRRLEAKSCTLDAREDRIGSGSLPPTPPNHSCH